MARAKKDTKKEIAYLEDIEEKKKALDTVVNQITKTYGAGSIMKLGENSPLNVSAVSTGSLTLDIALGVGGVPRGRIVEIYGPEASGKTTLAYALERRLFDLGRACTVLDARNMRRGISRELGFTSEERSENLRRSAEIAKLLNDAGEPAGFEIPRVKI